MTIARRRAAAEPAALGGAGVALRVVESPAIPILPRFTQSPLGVVFYWAIGFAAIFLAAMVLATAVKAETARMSGAGRRLENVEVTSLTVNGRAGSYVRSLELARILRGEARYDAATRMLTITAEGKKVVFLVDQTRFVISRPGMAQVAGRLAKPPVRQNGTTWIEKRSAESFLRQFHAASFRPLPGSILQAVLPIRPVEPAETSPTPPPTAYPAAPGAGARRETVARETGAVATFIRSIVIDAGHGDHDPGAVGPGGTREKDVNLDVAQRLIRALEPRVAGRVSLTRADDRFLSLKERVNVAKRLRADLFISIHSNSMGSSRGRSATGTEVYFFSAPSDEDARLAERIEGGPFDPRAEGIDPVLWDLMLAGNVVESHKLAQTIIDVLPEAVGLPNRGVKSARFYVMYFGVISNIPSVLVELGYLSNPREESKLADPQWRQKAADAIAEAVVTYLKDLEARYPGGRGWSR